MSLFAEYKREREGKEVIENDHAFAIYQVSGEDCYIEDIYVRPEYRGKSLATALADSITRLAKDKGCRRLFGSVATNANGAQDSLKVLLAYGMKIHSASNGMVFFMKEI